MGAASDSSPPFFSVRRRSIIRRVSFLYRVGLAVGHRQPYIDWANGVGDDGPDLPPELAAHRTVYLVSESEDEPDAGQLLDEFWQQIFEEELAAWMIDETSWPAPLTRELFDAWFEVELLDSLFDLTPEEPLTQTDVDAMDLEDAIHRCAWCDIAIEEGAGRFVGFKLSDRGRLAHREGLVVPLVVDDRRTVVGIMTRADSDSARAGDDLVFRACTSRCEKALRSVVPKALRRAFRQSQSSGRT